MRFYSSIVVMVFLSLVLLFWPMRMVFMEGGPQAPASPSFYTLCSLVGLIGVFASSTLLSLHRRLKALEVSPGPKG
jgi:hypothetical protein